MSTGSSDDSTAEVSGKCPEDDECIARLKTYTTKEKKGLGKGLLEKIHDHDKDFIGTVSRLVGAGCPGELAMDISLLLFYDLVILIDDSASMASERKMEALRGTLKLICGVYSHINSDGIKSVRYINNKRGKAKVTTEKVDAVVEGCARVGMSRIGAELRRKVLQPFVLGGTVVMTKPLLVVVISDGTPEGEEAAHLEKVIIDCIVQLKKKPALGGEAVAFHFDRIGQDKASIKLFQKIDDHDIEEVDKQVDSLPEDIDLLEVKEDEWEKRKWELIPKLLIGAIVPYWDERKTTKDKEDELAAGEGLEKRSKRDDDDDELLPDEE